MMDLLGLLSGYGLPSTIIIYENKKLGGDGSSSSPLIVVVLLMEAIPMTPMLPTVLAPINSREEALVSSGETTMASL